MPTRQIKKDSLAPLFKRNGVKLALLFGSTLESTTPGDLDIAVLFENYSFDAYLNTHEGLCQLLKTRNIDLVVLNRTNAIIKLEAFLKGILLFEADGENLTDSIVQSLFEYEDYRHFKREYLAEFQQRRIEGISMAERKLNREKVETYLSKLDEAVAELRKLIARVSSFEDFKSNVDLRELCVHYLRIALECVLGVCRHFLAVKGVSLTDIDTTNLIELSGEKGLIPYDFARRIRGMTGMRNAIVHVYWRLDYEAISRAVTEQLADFDEFVRYTEDFLKREDVDRGA